MERALLRATAHTAAGRLFIALWGGLALVDLGRPAGRPLSGVLVLVLVGCCGIGQTLPAAAAIAGTGWLVLNGFVLHEYGELGFSPTSLWLLGAAFLAVVSVALCTEAGPR